MSLKENLKRKTRLDRLTREIDAKIRTAPGETRLNLDKVEEVLALTDFEHQRARDMHLWVRPLEGEKKEILVLDNDLPIYHSTVKDVAMRKTPYWQEMVNIKNIIKILNDKDVVRSKRKESLRHLYELALDQIDYSYTAEDIEELFKDAVRGLDAGSSETLQENVYLFFDLLGFTQVEMPELDFTVQAFARPKNGNASAGTYEDLILVDRRRVRLSLRKGEFMLERDSETMLQEKPSLQDEEVLAYLKDMALHVDPGQRRKLKQSLYGPGEE
ncbi:MAG: hypothetical protein ACLFQR_05295 [Desulfovibrionales bacterium]